MSEQTTTLLPERILPPEIDYLKLKDENLEELRDRAQHEPEHDFTEAECEFIKEHLSSIQAFHKWREMMIAQSKWRRNPSTSAWNWNLELYPHKAHGCWDEIFRFCEFKCKKLLKPLKRHLRQASDFDAAHEKWVEDELKALKQIRETGLNWGAPVDPEDPDWRDENLNTDEMWFVAMLSRAFHHMQGEMLRSVIQVYLDESDDQECKSVLNRAILAQCALTEGINPPDKMYFGYMRDFPGLFNAVHLGLCAMRKNVWALEWCADWEPQLLFWAYPRGPGFALISQLCAQQHSEITNKHELYDALLDSKDQWKDVILQAWTNLPKMPEDTDSSNVRMIRKAMQQICTEFTVRTLPWYLSGCGGKALNSIHV